MEIQWKTGLYKPKWTVKSRGSDTFSFAKVAHLLRLISSLRFWTAELKHLNFKKNPDEIYFFIMEKSDFEKKSVTFYKKSFRRNDFAFVTVYKGKIVSPKGIFKIF